MHQIGACRRYSIRLKDLSPVFQLTYWSIPPLLTAIIAIAAYRRTQVRARVPGGHALRFLFASLIFWVVGQLIGTLLVQPASKLLVAQLTFVGITLTPVAWFLFALTYSQRVLKMSRGLLNCACVMPMVTTCLAVTNEWHGLIWTKWEVTNFSGYVGLVSTHGPWFYLNTVYSYGLILTATAILTFTLSQSRQHYQTVLAAIFAPLLGVIANLAFLSPLNPIPWFDVTTIGFLVGVLLLDHGILRRGLLNRTPVVRERVVEHLTDPVLVVDNNGIILDANQSALDNWCGGQDNILQTNISHLISTLPVTMLRHGVRNTEVTIQQRSYEVSPTSLDATNSESDFALVFRDVTDRLKAERELRQLKDELERMAHTDPLTGMFNRRFFMQRLAEEFERVKRHGNAVSVLIFDLDHFKEINDTFGHDIGDTVLIAIAEVANNVKRVSDVACRIGGEEFALLLPETDKAGALQLAQRLRDAIESYPYAERCQQSVKATASIGLATVSHAQVAPDTILKVADRALYRAKNSGRNRVCVDDELS
ncbi:MAG: diguanylate cyclase [Pseudomonadota bacterium]